MSTRIVIWYVMWHITINHMTKGPICAEIRHHGTQGGRRIAKGSEAAVLSFQSCKKLICLHSIQWYWLKGERRVTMSHCYHLLLWCYCDNALCNSRTNRCIDRKGFIDSVIDFPATYVFIVTKRTIKIRYLRMGNDYLPWENAMMGFDGAHPGFSPRRWPWNRSWSSARSGSSAGLRARSSCPGPASPPWEAHEPSAGLQGHRGGGVGVTFTDYLLSHTHSHKETIKHLN